MTLKLEGFSGWFDDPITGYRERWSRGSIVHKYEHDTFTYVWLQSPNPEPVL